MSKKEMLLSINIVGGSSRMRCCRVHLGAPLGALKIMKTLNQYEESKP